MIKQSETVKVNLSTINRVKDFSKLIAEVPFDLDLASGRYVIDAKSILAIFSLDLTKPIDLIIHTDNHVEIERLHLLLKDYIIN